MVAFRGTLPPLDLSPDGRTIVNPEVRGIPVIRDWENNLSAQVRRGVTIGGVTIAGAVHDGFAASLADLWPGVVARVDALRGAAPAPRLYFTGHSKGGALANLAAYCARRHWPAAIVKAATFGAPRAGDRDFANAYAASAIVCERYEVPEDVVPHVPQFGFVSGVLSLPIQYKEVGTPHKADGIFYPPRVGKVPHLPDLVAAHLPYSGFGYGDNVCEPGCPHVWR